VEPVTQLTGLVRAGLSDQVGVDEFGERVEGGVGGCLKHGSSHARGQVRCVEQAEQPEQSARFGTEFTVAEFHRGADREVPDRELVQPLSLVP
jgi:hypothetical protein